MMTEITPFGYHDQEGLDEITGENNDLIIQKYFSCKKRVTGELINRETENYEIRI